MPLSWGHRSAIQGSGSVGNPQQFDLKLECGVGRNNTTRTPCTVSQIGRDQQCANTTDFHARHPLVPATNHHARAERKDKWVITVLAGIKLGPLNGVVIEPAGVVNSDALPLGRWRA